jgi:hypothetical protein
MSDGSKRKLELLANNTALMRGLFACIVKCTWEMETIVGTHIAKSKIALREISSTMYFSDLGLKEQLRYLREELLLRSSIYMTFHFSQHSVVQNEGQLRFPEQQIACESEKNSP